MTCKLTETATPRDGTGLHDAITVSIEETNAIPKILQSVTRISLKYQRKVIIINVIELESNPPSACTP